jgi:hypothetical protein
MHLHGTLNGISLESFNVHFEQLKQKSLQVSKITLSLKCFKIIISHDKTKDNLPAHLLAQWNPKWWLE